jgi:hypothetical protein
LDIAIAGGGFFYFLQIRDDVGKGLGITGEKMGMKKVGEFCPQLETCIILGFPRVR